MSSLAGTPKPSLPSRALLLFVLLTFGVTWGVIGGYIYFPERAAGTFGAISGSHPLYFLATWAPGIAGCLLVLGFGGLRGLRAFLSRLLYWRCDPVWWAFILIGIPLVFMAGSLIKGGPLLTPLPPDGAGAIFGAAWGIWHLPAFYLAGVVFAEWRFLPFFIGNVTLAILVTPIFNSARGSLLLPMLFHWQLINPFWPDAQPWDTWILVAVTAGIVWWQRDAMFSRAGAVTDVIPSRPRP